MNVELAMASLEDAKANQDRFDMEIWWGGTPVIRPIGNGDKTLKDWPEPQSLVIDEANRIPPCGTVGCYAGFIAFRTAPAGTIIYDGDLYATEADVKAAIDGAEYADDGRPESSWSSVPAWAAAGLGITTSQATALFHLETLEQVEAAVNHLAANPDADYDDIVSAAGVEL